MAGTFTSPRHQYHRNDTYGHIDKDGRYRVNMLFDRDNRETGFESLWVRQSRQYAGDTYGLHPLLAAPKWRLALRTATGQAVHFRCAA